MFRNISINRKLVMVLVIFFVHGAFFFTARIYKCHYETVIYMNSDCENKRRQDTPGLLKWGNEPKETWHQHFLSVFNKLSLRLSYKNFPNTPCDKVFKETLTENMDIVSNYPFNAPQKYLRDLWLDAEGIDYLSRPVANPRKLPVIVTGASSNHYKESQGMLRTFHRLLNMYNDLKLIYYDLGLTEEERAELEVFCKCEVRRNEAERYSPQAAGLLGYAWKPILIQQVLKEYDFVMWNDVSIKYNGKCLDDLIYKTRLTGFQCKRDETQISERQTSKTIVDFLKESPCLYNTPEVEGGLIIISRNRFTLEYLMKPWVSCGLSDNCVIFNNSQLNRHCPEDGSLFPNCHRFDQSMLGILVYRLFQDHRNIVEFNWSEILKTEQYNDFTYFNDLRDAK